MKSINPILTGTVLLPALTLILSGCWTPPNPNAQPSGEPRLIQTGLRVESVKEDAEVATVDIHARTLTLKLSGNQLVKYPVGKSVGNLALVQMGNKVTATITEELDIYLLADGRLPNGATAEKLGVNAKLIFNDPNADASYRLLTLVYPNGQKETVKVSEMADGDSVVVRPVEVIKIEIEKP